MQDIFYFMYENILPFSFYFSDVRVCASRRSTNASFVSIYAFCLDSTTAFAAVAMLMYACMFLRAKSITISLKSLNKLINNLSIGQIKFLYIEIFGQEMWLIYSSSFFSLHGHFTLVYQEFCRSIFPLLLFLLFFGLG